ncbi:MAG TPA: hypothetical protein P5250_04395, partial [Bacteroidales bacterium]|nr:hypothetical protein [Bacteroidales bacterium]
MNTESIKSVKYSFSLNNEVERGCFLRGDKIIYKDNDFEEVVFIDNNGSRQIKGEHNLQNLMAAIIVCKLQGIDNKTINEGIKTMSGLKYRMEYIGNYGGIDFYNDSISTIPESTIAAVKAIPNVHSLILGGFDRGIDYLELANFLVNSNVVVLIFIDNAGKRIMNLIKEIKNNKKLFLVNTLEEAVLIAKKETPYGKSCLLSPAAASYGMFKSFEERGEVFNYLCKKIKI